jgi:hypothetical protein
MPHPGTAAGTEHTQIGQLRARFRRAPHSAVAAPNGGYLYIKTTSPIT